MKIIPYSAEWHDRVLAFRHRMYPDNPLGHTDAHFRWRFLNNPLSTEPVYLLAVQGDTILGQWAGLHDRVWSGGQAWPVVWMVDLIVAPEHRDTMAALALFRAAQRLGRSLLATGAPTEMLDFYRSFRWTRLSVADTFFSVFRPGAVHRLIGQEVSAWTRPALRMADALGPHIHAATLRGARVEELDGFGPEVDALWERLRDRLGTVSERSAATLTWKFTQRPCGQHITLGLREAGGLRGYAVVKLRERQGVARWAEIADILVDPDDDQAFIELANAGRSLALEHGADFARLRCSLPQHTTQLRSPWWMRKVRSPMDDTFVFAKGPARAALSRPPWVCTAFCSDNVDTGLDEV